MGQPQYTKEQGTVQEDERRQGREPLFEEHQHQRLNQSTKREPNQRSVQDVHESSKDA